jgi:hypothetical protein
VLIQAQKPIDRQVIILRLEELAANEIADIASISPAHTYAKLTRIRQFSEWTAEGYAQLSLMFLI